VILLGLNLAADVLGLKSQDLVIKNWDDGEYVRGFLIDERAIGPTPSDRQSICRFAIMIGNALVENFEVRNG
tara:strand:+ start:670 stop:885 length:216 start_codon:yes stop_codon:yes gene_type:complete